MRLAAALLLGACLVAAGCKPAAKDPTVLEKEAARADELKKLKGWERAFGGPERTIAIANQFGYRNAPYKAFAKGGFRSSGASPMISDSFAQQPNATYFVATGDTADQIDALEFSLVITDLDSAATAKSRFREILNNFLRQFEVGIEEDVKAMVTQEVAAAKTYPGADVRVEKQPVEGGPEGSRRLVVTFIRTGGTAPATQAPEAQGK